MLSPLVGIWSDPRRRRWVLWSVLAGTFLLVNIYRLSTAVIADELMAAFRATGTQLATIHAMFFVVYAVMQVPTGILVDRIGPRRTAAVGAAVMHLGAVWFTLANTYYAAIGARFLIGLGGSVIFVSLLGFCAAWFRPAGFATMNGLSFAVGGLGGILATAPFAFAVSHLGWQTTVQGLATIGFGLALLTILIVHDRPQAAGFAAIGTPRQYRVALEDVRAAFRELLTDQWMWVVGTLLFCTTGVNLTIFGLWGIPYITQLYGTSVQVASLFTMVGGIGGVLGPPVIGWLAARTGRRASIVLAGGMCYTISLGALAIIETPPLVLVAIVYFLIGVLLGAFVVTYPLMKERYPGQNSGVVLGTINGMGFLGASVMPTLMGWILDAYWTGEVVRGARVYTVTGYRVAFGLAALTGVVTIFCGLWLTRKAGHARGKSER